ncbi:MAG: MCE family protein [Alphaproteobacteria bacterium]|nr:MCE family protein [Alphaproteobacteria bacterium]
MKKNPIEAVLGIGVLAFAFLFLFFAAGHVNVRPVDGYKLKAYFTKIGGLEMGADVRINGIKVGSVTKIELEPETYRALIELTIKDNIRLPKDTKASVVDSGIMGDKYIRLEPGKDSQKLPDYSYLTKTTPYKSLEDNVREFIFLSTKDDVQKDDDK